MIVSLAPRIKVLSASLYVSFSEGNFKERDGRETLEQEAHYLTEEGLESSGHWQSKAGLKVF